MRPAMARPADPHAREALVAAARAEFVKKGLRGARIEDITAACGLSKGAFYLHFPSKEALFGEVVARVQGGAGRDCASGASRRMAALLRRARRRLAARDVAERIRALPASSSARDRRADLRDARADVGLPRRVRTC